MAVRLRRDAEDGAPPSRPQERAPRRAKPVASPAQPRADADYRPAKPRSPRPDRLRPRPGAAIAEPTQPKAPVVTQRAEIGEDRAAVQVPRAHDPDARPLRPSPSARGGRPGRGERSADGLLFGLHAVRAALLNPDRVCRRLLVTPDGLTALTETLAEVAARGINRPAPEAVTRSGLERRLPAGAVHQGIALKVDPLPERDLDDLGRTAALRPAAVVVVLDRVTDPHNVGAVLRSAAAFGALGVVVTDRHAPPVTGTLARAASGAVEHLPIVRVANLAQALGRIRDWGFVLLGLDERAETTLDAWPAAPRVALVLGAEGEGLRRLTRETCDVLVRLPTGGPIATLNVSNAAAVALYELTRPRPQG